MGEQIASTRGGGLNQQRPRQTAQYRPMGQIGSLFSGDGSDSKTKLPALADGTPNPKVTVPKDSGVHGLGDRPPDEDLGNMTPEVCRCKMIRRGIGAL